MLISLNEYIWITDQVVTGRSYSSPLTCCVFTDDVAADENLRKLMDVKLEQIAQPRHVTEDVLCDAEDDPVNFLSLIVESLATLKKMPEAIQVTSWRIRMWRDLLCSSVSNI